MGFSMNWTCKEFVLLVNLILICNVIFVRTLPNERQAHELMLLEDLGKKGGMSTDHDTLMGLVSRSR